MSQVERSFPRAVVSLQVDVVGAADPVDVVVVPRRCSVTRRPHTHADTSDLEIDGTQVPFDPRTIRSVVATVHMGQARAGEDSAWFGASTRRFVGYTDTFNGEQEDDDTIVLKLRDLSSSLRDAKPLPTAATPKYTDTLRGAIQRVLDTVPGGNALTLDMVDGDVPLNRLTAGRLRGGHVHLERDMTAWAVIEYVAGLADRIVNVELDTLHVRLPRSSYAHQRAPRVDLEFNTVTANLTKLATEKKFVRNRKGIRVVGWDPATRSRLEVDYPPDAELPSRSRSAAPGRGRRRAAPQPPERDVFAVGAVSNLDSLRDIARGVWEERSRQELGVTVETPYFADPFLDLRNGDRVRLQLNRALASGLNLSQPKAAQVSFVQRRLGVDRRAAEVLVSAATTPGADIFYLHELTLNWNPEGDIGAKLDLINLIALEAD